ncbi:MAG TPA: recombinase family protein [Pseudonocardiaceae bacterium]|jgi:hypothetical protein
MTARIDPADIVEGAQLPHHPRTRAHTRHIDDLAGCIRRLPTRSVPDGPLLPAFGYVRVSTDAPDHVDDFAGLLKAWADAGNWHLVEVFRDVGVGTDELARPGFAAPLEALQQTPRATVLLPTPYHLSFEPDTGQILLDAICETDARPEALSEW